MLYLVQKTLVKHMLALGSHAPVISDQEMKTLHLAYTRMSNLELLKKTKPLFSQSLQALAAHLNLGSTLERVNE